MTTSISISISQMQMPKPSMQLTQDELLDKIRLYCELVNHGGSSSSYEWDYLKAVFLKLQIRNHLSYFEKCILELVEPIITKYMSDDPTFADKVDGTKLNRYQDLNNDNEEE